MHRVESISNVRKPTHISKCTGTVEHAHVFSLKSGDYASVSWLKRTETEDSDKIKHVNESLPDLPEASLSIETTFKKGNTTYFLVDDAIVGLEDGVKMAVPDAIYLQRISHRTKTFDMVCFYGKKYSVFSAIDKSSMETIRKWFPSQVYSCGADPLPLRAMSKQLGSMTHDEIFEELFGESSAEESAYEPDSCDEQEDDHDLEDEVYESESEDLTEEEYEEEEETEDEEDEDYEPETKRRKT